MWNKLGQYMDYRIIKSSKYISKRVEQAITTLEGPVAVEVEGADHSGDEPSFARLMLLGRSLPSTYKTIKDTHTKVSIIRSLK